MHPRVESFPKPQPDHRELLKAVRRERPARVPLIELAVDPEMAAFLLEEPLPPLSELASRQRAAAAAQVRLLARLGYDVAKVSATIPFQLPRVSTSDTASLSRGDRAWQDEHHGAISSLEDCERYPWPSVSQVDFGPLDAAAEVLPEGMALIGFCGGVLEFAMDLMGMEPFMLAVYDQPDLVEDVLSRVGKVLEGVFIAYAEMDSVCALWLGDDLGSRNGLLVSPELLETHVFPWYRRYVEIAHHAGKPFLLHSCGDIESVMPALVERVGIDAKHSFQDAIQPVEQFIDRWGQRVAPLGGIDVHLLATGDEDAVAKRTLVVLERATGHGAYACGSGNSVTNYVPPGNYLAMVETVARFNA